MKNLFLFSWKFGSNLRTLWSLGLTFYLEKGHLRRLSCLVCLTNRWNRFLTQVFPTSNSIFLSLFSSIAGQVWLGAFYRLTRLFRLKAFWPRLKSLDFECFYCSIRFWRTLLTLFRFFINLLVNRFLKAESILISYSFHKTLMKIKLYSLE